LFAEPCGRVVKLAVTELWQEERMQMKLADARAAMEERLWEIDDVVAELHTTSAGNRTICGGGVGVEGGVRKQR